MATTTNMVKRMVALLVAALFCGATADACVDSSSSTTTGSGGATSSGAGNFDRNALLASVTDNVVLVTLDAFYVHAQALAVATAAYADVQDEDNRVAAQQAWRMAMRSWQRAEVIRLGPAGSATAVAGGLDLRDEIYSWPIINHCRVDQETVAGNFNDVAAFRNQPVNVRGLDALEYLLFNSSVTNACPPQNVINSGGGWNGIGAELTARRASYAATVAQLVVTSAAALRNAWRDGFADELRHAGQGASRYPSAQEALNAVTDAMFYLEVATKDLKLAVPVGLSDCAAALCPDKLELPLSRGSKWAIEQNLLAFEALFFGGAQAQPAAIGFDDWLRAYGADTLALNMGVAIAAAKDALAAIEQDDLVTALAEEPASVAALYFAIKAVTDQFKTDVVTVLNLDLPNSVQGDDD